MKLATIHRDRRRLLGGALGTLGAGLLGGTVPPVAAQPAPRLALVIGNAAYRASPLSNPVRDARAMAAVLRQLGFEVIELHDAARPQMMEAIDRAAGRLAGRQGAGLFYFAGHGLQMDWRNYLLPVDAEIGSAGDLLRQAVDVQRVIEAFGATGSRVNIMVLDACRDNPFGQATSGKGLAPVDAPSGMFLAYATAPGHVADDGTVGGGNGLYTGYLLREMQRQDARIEDVFKRVRLQVRQASQGRQVPWESTSLEHDFVFATARPVAAPTVEQRDAEFDAEKAEWDRIAASQRSDDLLSFLVRHPNGHISELAQFRLDQLARPAIEPLWPASAPRVLPAGTDRFRVGDAWELNRTDHVEDRRQRVRARVTSIEGGRVLVNNGNLVMDQMGSVLVNRFGTKDPGMLVSPAGLQIGRRWRTAFTNTQAGLPPRRNYYDCRVDAVEELQVPDGRFLSFRIEARGESSRDDTDGGRRLQWTTWIDPATMMSVRHELRFTTKRRERVVEQVSDLLQWRQLMPRG